MSSPVSGQMIFPGQSARAVLAAAKPTPPSVARLRATKPTDKRLVIAIIVVTSIEVTALSKAEAGWFGPNNYAECIFERMEGVSSDKAALAIAGACRRQFPGDSTPGFFGPNNFDDCIATNMKNVSSDNAALAIASACRQLFSSSGRSQSPNNPKITR